MAWHGTRCIIYSQYIRETWDVRRGGDSERKVGEYLLQWHGFLSFFLSSSSPAKMTRYDDSNVPQYRYPIT